MKNKYYLVRQNRHIYSFVCHSKNYIDFLTITTQRNLILLDTHYNKVRLTDEEFLNAYDVIEINPNMYMLLRKLFIKITGAFLNFCGDKKKVRHVFDFVAKKRYGHLTFCNYKHSFRFSIQFTGTKPKYTHPRLNKTINRLIIVTESIFSSIRRYTKARFCNNRSIRKHTKLFY